MRGIDDEDAMQRESRRTRIDVADAGQKKRRQHLPVGNTAQQLLDRHFRALVARCVLDQTDERLDVRTEPDDIGSDLSFGPAEQERRGEQPVKDITPRNRHHSLTPPSTVLYHSIGAYWRFPFS